MRIRSIALSLLLGLSARPLIAQGGHEHRPAQLKVIEIKEPDGQILSYRHLAGSTEVKLKGTKLAPQARIKLKVGSRPGFVELDINRGGISGLPPAQTLGKDFLTYVLWAVSVDGRAHNLGEITFDGGEPVAINVTTPYQTFWLMVTAEPNYAVVDPSPKVVLYSVKGDVDESQALIIKGDLYYFTHYSDYDAGPAGSAGAIPNQLLQARKAVELAAKSENVAANTKSNKGSKEDEYTREAMKQANAFLKRAEQAYQKDARHRDVAQFARTAAQSAENARALAQGAVGGTLVRQLQSEATSLRDELEKSKTAVSSVGETVIDITDQAENPSGREKLAAIISKPSVWFAVVGWGLALVLLFRRRSS